MLVGSCLKPVKIEFAKNIISKVSQKNDVLEQKFPYGKTFAVNGEYDAATVKAVKAFQEQYSLKMLLHQFSLNLHVT